MTPQEFSNAQREYLIRTEKQSAVFLIAEFEKLKANITAYLAANFIGAVAVSKLVENSFLAQILLELETQLLRIKNPFTRIITRAQRSVVSFAAEQLNKFLDVSIFSPEKSAIQKLIGRTQSGTTLSNVFERMNPVVRERAKETLIEGFSMGESSQAIANRLADVVDIARYRALTIARTETNEAYRAASRDFYEQAEIKEYYWISKLDSRTCLICWLLHGRKFKTKFKTFSHPNCRCVLLPKMKATANIPTGADLFLKLEKSVQKQILGEKRFEQLQAGIKLSDFVRSENSEDYGERFFIKNL